MILNLFDWFVSLFHKKQTINSADYLYSRLQSEPLTNRKSDFGIWQVADCMKVDNTRFITTWSYPPFEEFKPNTKDGGEQYEIEGHDVIIECTLDEGHPYVQWFVGDGWFVFSDDVTDQWKSRLVRLAGHPDPLAEPPLNPAFTRYKRATITFPSIGSVDTIISEHYAGESIEKAYTMERFFFAKGYGRVCWQAWGKEPEVSQYFGPLDAYRAPDFGYNSIAGWRMYDTRVQVNSASDKPLLTGLNLWHP